MSFVVDSADPHVWDSRAESPDSSSARDSDPELPAEGYSDDARDFVSQCLHRLPEKRPTYAELLVRTPSTSESLLLTLDDRNIPS